MSVGREGSASSRRFSRDRRAHTGAPSFRLDLSHPLLAQVLATALLTLMTIQIFGAWSNALQILLALMLAAIHWRSALASAPRLWIFLLYPILAAASAYWSDAPDVSLRYGIQFLFTAAAGLLVAITVGPTRFVACLYLANLIVAIGSLFNQRYGLSMEGPVLIGLTGSKNQIAFVSQLTIASAAAIFLDKNQPKLLRISTIGGGLVALMLLVQANSATGVLTAIGATAAFLGLMILRQFRPAARVWTVSLALVVLMPAIAAKDIIVEQAQHISTTVFKKDPTLTGRTYLWAQADRLIDQRPIVGHGYRSVWLGQSVTTTGLLRGAGQTSGRGYNFHNTFKEVTVDTGFVGLAAFVFSMVLIGFLMLTRFLREGSLTTAFFFSTYLTYVARAFTELIIGPFQAGALILFCLAGYAVLRRPPDPSRPAARI